MRTYDCIVVGGGLVGVATTYALARDGAQVLLVERDEIAAHASSAAAGMLTPTAESSGLPAIFEVGVRALRGYAERVRELAELSGVDPDLRTCGALLVRRDAALSDLDRVAGLDRVSARRGARLGADELEKRVPALSRDLAGGLWLPEEGHVRASRLARAYRIAAERRGAQVHTSESLTRLRWDGARVVGIETTAGRYAAGAVVLCAGAWTNALASDARAQLPVVPVKGQMISLDPVGVRLPSIVWDEKVYLVPRGDGSLHVGATVEHAGFDVRPTAAGVAALLEAARALVPDLGAARFVRAWAGLRPASPDHLPLVGALHGTQGGLYVAAGHYRFGVLLCGVTGDAIADRILRGAVADGFAAFDPGRFAGSRSS